MGKGRIVIITQPLHANYGGVMQAYALQRVIAKRGFDVRTDLRRPRQISTLVLFASWCFRLFMRYILRQKEYKPVFPYSPSYAENSIISANLRSFVYDNMRTVELFQKNGLCSDSDVLNDFETIIVGSDQVWRPFLGSIEPKYLLDFVENRAVKRIAYAASFGVGIDDIMLFNRKLYEKLARKFDAVSVREHSGVAICKEYFGVDATQVLDPTMLLCREAYEELAADSNEPATSGDLMCYVLDKTAEKEQIVRKISSSLNLTPFIAGAKSELNWSTRSTIEQCIAPSVASWLRGFMDAKFVFTDSFHGVVFSIIFNKPFVAILNKERGADRFYSLLSLFGLENRLIHSIEQIDDKVNQAIDWPQVNNIQARHRAQSESFLLKSLGIDV